jgi:predicted benzoate:H+ symporter BenE
MAIVPGKWSTTGVNALLTGLIGVAATLLGSFTTYLFQSRNELREREDHFEAAVTTFIHAASKQLRATAPASAPGRPGQDAPTSAA